MNDGRVRDLEFRVKDLQGEIKALKRKLANIANILQNTKQELIEEENEENNATKPRPCLLFFLVRWR
tara:strand:+ start:211 stop:411 length:201 start_codon:yes stop_codon:yes gene_type:complete